MTRQRSSGPSGQFVSEAGSGSVHRRSLLALIGGAMAGLALARSAHAQRPAMPVVGYLGAVSPDGFTERQGGLRQGLKEVGFVEGENVAIEYRWADNQLDRLPELAAELVRKQVAVLVATGGTAPAIAAKAATTNIPVVFTVPEDPVKLGLVSSLSRPGGNLTGVNLIIGELVAKRLELLRQFVPALTRIAFFTNPANGARADAQVREVEAAARTIGLQVSIFRVGTSRDINEAFETLGRERPDALFVGPDPFFVTRRVQLVTLAARHALPTSFSVRDFAAAGGLMSYGTDIADAYRHAGVYAGRILKGTKPADLPVLQSSKFELVINVQTARMLGLTVPSSVLTLADEVIE